MPYDGKSSSEQPIWKTKIESIYFGGGTPSLLEAEDRTDHRYDSNAF
jgi:coproporphyrinogen III oxidase-like Fe-S oxidoreductase